MTTVRFYSDDNLLGSCSTRGDHLVFRPADLRERLAEPRWDRDTDRKLTPDDAGWFDAVVGGRIWRANVIAVAYGAVYAAPPTEPVHDAAFEAPEGDDPFDRFVSGRTS
jgi:hypothetical protein